MADRREKPNGKNWQSTGGPLAVGGIERSDEYDDS
jgi:hypothetical protein